MQPHDPSKNIQAMAAAGLNLASPYELGPAHSLVERLIGPPLASLATIQAVQAHTGSSVFVFREGMEITGVLGELPLSELGLRALECGRFSGTNVDTQWIAQPGEVVRAYYCWGNAAVSRRAAAATVKGMVIARDEIYPELPYFARAALPADGTHGKSNGARISLRRFNCTFHPSQPDLLYSPRSVLSRNVAA